jgi:hypothetical protein
MRTGTGFGMPAFAKVDSISFNSALIFDPLLTEQ